MDDDLTLFRAILAMDAYNQGYAKGTIGVGNKIGSATITSQSDINPGEPGVSAGFYAVSYTVTDGSKVISYRGTDANFVLPFSDTGSDLVNGYGLAAGFGNSKQSELAIKFYNDVAGQGVDPRTANIVLTGHSLVGGLAGLVGSLRASGVSISI